MFLEQANENELIPLTNRLETMGKVLSHVIKSLVTAEWWEKIFDLAECLVDEVPIYRLRFDKSGRMAELLEDMIR